MYISSVHNAVMVRGSCVLQKSRLPENFNHCHCYYDVLFEDAARAVTNFLKNSIKRNVLKRGKKVLIFESVLGTINSFLKKEKVLFLDFHVLKYSDWRNRLNTFVKLAALLSTL